MIGDKTSARWIAIVGGVVILSTCVACLLLTLLLTGAYGGQTVQLRNPFAPPTLAVVGDTGENTGSGSQPNGSSPATGGNIIGAAPTASGGNTFAPSNTNASSYLPTLSGYTTADTSNIEGALNLAFDSGVFGAQNADGSEFSAQGLGLSAIATTVLVTRIDDFIGCYRQTGAVDARVYIRADLNTVLNGGIPPMGAVAVANQDRLRESLIRCAVSPNDPNSFSAQSANQPCGNFGTFTALGDTFTYVYAGSSTDFCNAIEAHFGAYGG